MTRGVRLNNPGNVRVSNTPWVGKVAPSQDPDFETFDTPEHGIRAIACILLTYFNEDSLDTIEGIISRWAPSSENDTQAYVEDVSTRTGFSASEELTPDAETLADLIQGIIWHENGTNPYSDTLISAAVADALSAHGAEEPATHNID